MNSEVLLNCLYICMSVMAVLAIFYLRERKLTNMEYLFWGLLAVVVPVIGPYLVISSRPGELYS